MCAKCSFIRTSIYNWLVLATSYQAGLSYGSNQAVKKITGKSTTENIKSFVDDNKIKVEEEESHEEFFALVKSRIEKTSKIIKLANQ